MTTLAPEVSIVMPVFNERATIEQAIRSVLDAGVADSFELIVVDDGSTDGSSELLSSGEWPEHVRVLSHDRNRGKGAALRTALAQARGVYTTVMDADLEYAPSDIPAMLEPLRSDRAEAVFGTRGFQAHSAYSFWYVIGESRRHVLGEFSLQQLGVGHHDRTKSHADRTVSLAEAARARIRDRA